MCTVGRVSAVGGRLTAPEGPVGAAVMARLGACAVWPHAQQETIVPACCGAARSCAPQLGQGNVIIGARPIRSQLVEVEEGEAAGSLGIADHEGPSILCVPRRPAYRRRAVCTNESE